MTVDETLTAQTHIYFSYFILKISKKRVQNHIEFLLPAQFIKFPSVRFYIFFIFCESPFYRFMTLLENFSLLLTVLDKDIEIVCNSRSSSPKSKWWVMLRAKKYVKRGSKFTRMQFYANFHQSMMGSWIMQIYSSLTL